MFNDKKKKSSPSGDSDIYTQTLIAEGVTIKDGNLYGSNSVTISGVFFGDVDIEGVIILTECGNIKGNVKADEAYIYGTVEGSITTKGRVHIYSGSSVMSDINSSSLTVEENAVFKGLCSTAIPIANNVLNIAGSIAKHQDAVGEFGVKVNGKVE